MVGLGLLTGLVFPVFLETLRIATPDRAESLAARLACATAGVAVGGANYALARLVVGGRLQRLTGHLRRIDDIVRTATLTGDWSALVLNACQIPVDSTDDLGQTAEAFNALVGALDHNVAERRRLEARLHHQAFHDPLTGLANRALFVDRLAHCLNRARREHTFPAVLYLDLDGFKAVNDTLGHAAGDNVLVETARRLLAGRRLTDTVARLGGDEFAILLEDVSPDHPEQAAQAAQALRESLQAPMTLGLHRVHLGASIGIALADGRTDDPHTLLAQADAAMYQAKRDAKAGEPAGPDRAEDRITRAPAGQAPAGPTRSSVTTVSRPAADPVTTTSPGSPVGRTIAQARPS
jgi:diguanylate cyclase (GGDEF)-like protein